MLHQQPTVGFRAVGIWLGLCIVAIAGLQHGRRTRDQCWGSVPWCASGSITVGYVAAVQRHRRLWTHTATWRRYRFQYLIHGPGLWRLQQMEQDLRLMYRRGGVPILP